MKKVELLAPAGSFDALKAAVNNGADAVYLGGKNFSARAFANNFSHEELIEAINYCHLRNVRVFVTVNTLLNEDEIVNAIKECDFYYKSNVDALLIQDLGLYYLLKNKYPDFELHCSTQMHVSNIEGIKTAKKLGFKRVVIPRESDLSFIKEACKEDIEIECFIHGAICVSYSGQCLMSSYTNNRSANKGMCAQCCRLDYDLIDENNNILNKDNPYILSPKDMFLLKEIPELIKAGVSSFKIEGRMKSSAYVGYITSIYRKAIDAYYNKQKFFITEEILNNMKVLFNRDFTSAYLNNNLDDLFSKNKPNHLGILIGKVESYNQNKVKVKLFDKLNQFDGVRLVDKDKEEGFIVNYLYKDTNLVNSANKNDYIELNTNNKFNKGSLLYKTIDKELEDSINSIEDKRIPLDIDLLFESNKEIVIKGIVDNKEYIYNSNIIPEEAIKAPIEVDRLKEVFSKLKETPYYLNNINVKTNNAFLPIKSINELRRNFIEFLNNERLLSFNREIIETNIDYIDITDEDHNLDIIESNKEYDNCINISKGSPINKESIYTNVIYDVGGILKNIDNKIAYYTLNISNSYAYEFLKRLGFKYIILSSELNSISIDRLIEEYSKRINKRIKPYAYYEGNRVLMYLKGNPFKEYDKDNLVLRNNKNTYKLVKNNEIIEIKQVDGINKDFNNKCLKLIILD